MLIKRAFQISTIELAIYDLHIMYVKKFRIPNAITRNGEVGIRPGLHENKLIRKSFLLKAIFSKKSNPPHSFFEIEPNTTEQEGNKFSGS